MGTFISRFLIDDIILRLISKFQIWNTIIEVCMYVVLVCILQYYLKHEMH